MRKSNTAVNLPPTPHSCCFGINWKLPDEIETPHFKLPGTRSPGAPIVDFSGQYGFYFLYDGETIVHRGRTIGSLGKSLYRHTKDHLAGKWDNFSWFGLRPVNENNELDPFPPRISVSWSIKLIHALFLKILTSQFNTEFNTEEVISDVVLIEYMQ